MQCMKTPGKMHCLKLVLTLFPIVPVFPIALAVFPVVLALRGRGNYGCLRNERVKENLKMHSSNHAIPYLALFKSHYTLFGNLGRE
ncbi:hypothetical protein CPB84DRAFT_1775557 [Gymnopilus junonius]|uniref:Uncharacterized protein n=1 Tax=Gymnopilus junonius TaxID=109634 RepID=A0A9P5NN95_GYMJU|nr:hypothetical protein CPB84DRAFT_1775557 [Gymnopilus junonius]